MTDPVMSPQPVQNIPKTEPAKPALPKKLQQEVDWADSLAAKAMTTGYEPTEAEKERYDQAVQKVFQHKFGTVPHVVISVDCQPEKSDESVKGLLDYPKDILLGLSAAAFKSSAKNAEETALDVQEMRDDFSASAQALRNGELDKTVIKALEGLGDVAEYVGNGIQYTASTLVAGAILIPAAAVNGLDRLGEYIADKLSNSKNNYSKTLGLIPRAIFGKNSNEGYDESTLRAVQEGIAEARK